MSPVRMANLVRSSRSHMPSFLQDVGTVAIDGLHADTEDLGFVREDSTSSVFASWRPARTAWLPDHRSALDVRGSPYGEDHRQASPHTAPAIVCWKHEQEERLWHP